MGCRKNISRKYASHAADEVQRCSGYTRSKSATTAGISSSVRMRIVATASQPVVIEDRAAAKRVH